MAMRLTKAMAVVLTALATLTGTIALANSEAEAFVPTTSTTSKVFYAADCSKQELFRNRPAPGAILPGEVNYPYWSEEVVAVWEDGTRVYKNSVIIYPNGMYSFPYGYTEPVDHGDYVTRNCTGETYWCERTGQYEMQYGPQTIEMKEPPYQPEPQPEDHTYDWNSVTVVDRFVDGTKLYGNGLIIHPDGVWHTPSDWVDVDEQGTTRYINVYYDETVGEWTVAYEQLAAPVEEPLPELGEPPLPPEADEPVCEEDDIVWDLVPTIEDETDVEEPVKAEEAGAAESVTTEEAEESPTSEPLPTAEPEMVM